MLLLTNGGHIARQSCFAFTLIELLITLSIVSILMLIALPSLDDFRKRQSLRVSIDTLETSLNLARQTAVTGNHCPVVIRADDAGWQNGWSIFRDCQRNAQIDDGEIIVWRQNMLSENVTMVGNAHAAMYVLFEDDGSSKRINGALGMASITACPRAQPADPDCLRLTLNAAGRIRRYKPNA